MYRPTTGIIFFKFFDRNQKYSYYDVILNLKYAITLSMEAIH